ncbi:MAG: hypothetical protein EB084_06600 [Proteobacteria bacterium]|nr:hypothetical protein [Pseudomonadota bacterium]
MSEQDARGLADQLKGGRSALTPALEGAFVAGGGAAIKALVAIISDETLLAASEPEGWAPIHAVRLLARLRAYEAIPALTRILDGAEDDDLVSAEVAQALRTLGTAALPSVARFIAHTENPCGRALALEVVANLRLDGVSLETFTEVREVLERLLLETDEPGLRVVLVEYLGEIGSLSSAQTLLSAVERPMLTAREYDALRDALERMGVVCPDLYFDAEGKGYPLDDEKLPRCRACAARMIVDASGDLVHPGSACGGRAADGRIER